MGFALGTVAARRASMLRRRAPERRRATAGSLFTPPKKRRIHTFKFFFNSAEEDLPIVGADIGDVKSKIDELLATIRLPAAAPS